MENAYAAAPTTDVLLTLIERMSTESTFDVAKLENLLDVKERWEREESRKAFVSALAAFKRKATLHCQGEDRRFQYWKGEDTLQIPRLRRDGQGYR